MATLRLARITFEGRHGATAAERRRVRRFEVDVEIEADLSVAERSDQLADTLDYRAVADTIVEIGEGESHQLLESLGRRMLDAVAARFPKATLRLELRKLAPPRCAGRPEYAAVRLTHR